MGYSCTAYKTWDVCVCVYIYVSRQRPDFCLFGLWFARAACARLSFVLYATSSTSLLLLPFFWLLNIFLLLLFGGPVVFSLLSPFLSRGIWIWIGPACRRVEPVHSALSKGEMYQTLASSSLSLLIIRRFWARKWSPWRALFHKGGYRLPNVKIHSIRKWCEIIYMRTQTIFERKNPFLSFFVFFFIALNEFTFASRQKLNPRVPLLFHEMRV